MPIVDAPQIVGSPVAAASQPNGILYADGNLLLAQNPITTNTAGTVLTTTGNELQIQTTGDSESGSTVAVRGRTDQFGAIITHAASTNCVDLGFVDRDGNQNNIRSEARPEKKFLSWDDKPEMHFYYPGAELTHASISPRGVRFLSRDPSKFVGMSTGMSGNGLVVISKDHYLYCLDNGGYLNIYDTEYAAGGFITVANFSTGLSVTGMDIQGDYAYITDGSNLRVYYIRDRANPVGVGTLATAYVALNVIVRGNYAYVPGYGGFDVIDVSTPAAPVSVASPGWSFIGSNPYQMDIRHDILYVADAGGGGMEMWDIATPTAPAFYGGLNNATTYSDIKVRGGLIFLMNKAGYFEIYSASNSTTPSLYTQIAVAPECERFVLMGTMAIFIDTSGFIRVVTFEDLASSHYVSTTYDTAVGSGQCICIGGANVFCSAKSALFRLEVGGVITGAFESGNEAYS